MPGGSYAKLIWTLIGAVSTLAGAFGFVYYLGLESGRSEGDAKLAARLQKERELVEAEFADRLQLAESGRDVAQKQRANLLVEIDKLKVAAQQIESAASSADDRARKTLQERDALALQVSELKSSQAKLAANLWEAQATIAQLQLQVQPPPEGPAPNGGGDKVKPPTVRKPLASTSIAGLQFKVLRASVSDRNATLSMSVTNTSKQSIPLLAWPPMLGFGADGSAPGEFKLNGRFVPNRASGGATLEPGIEYAASIAAADIPAGSQTILSIEMQLEVGKVEKKLVLKGIPLTVN